MDRREIQIPMSDVDQVIVAEGWAGGRFLTQNQPAVLMGRMKGMGGGR